MSKSLDAEKALLGSMILDPMCIGDIEINIDDFHRPEHKAIYEAILSCWERDGNVDLVMLRDELKDKGKLELAGSVEGLVAVAESTPTAANAQYYATIVAKDATVRNLLRVGHEIINLAQEPGDIQDKLSKAEEKVFAITESTAKGQASRIDTVVRDVYEAVEARDGTLVTGLATGFKELDDMLCGLQDGEMTIIAGRPSMGKTSLAMNIMENVGINQQVPAVCFSLEMSKGQLVERMVCSRGQIDSQKARRGTMDKAEFSKFQEICAEVNNAPIYLDDTAGMTPLNMLAKCRRLKSHSNIGCVIIDYLGLMSMGGKYQNRQAEVSEMSRQLKAMARELNVPVVVLSQLNRGSEHREGHRPRMSDLRDSGSIEQDADVVMLLHREAYYHRNDPDYGGDETEAEVIVAKQRNGPVGTVKLTFDGKFTRFSDRRWQ